MTKNTYLYLLYQLNSKGGRTDLSEFVNEVTHDIEQKDSSIKRLSDIKEWCMSLIAFCQTKGLINCYYLRGENYIEPCATSDTNFNPKHIDITFLGKAKLRGKKPTVPTFTQDSVGNQANSQISTKPKASHHSKLKQPIKEITVATENERTQEKLTVLLEEERNRIGRTSIKEIAKHIAGRQGQAGFRSGLLARFKERCCVTGCNIQDILEAAHIDPFHETQNHDWWNGIILRCDIHTLFDLNLLTIRMKDTLSGQVLLHTSLRPKFVSPQEEIFKHYKGLAYVTVELPDLGSIDENEKRQEVLDKHMKKCFATHGKQAFETDVIQ